MKSSLLFLSAVVAVQSLGMELESISDASGNHASDNVVRWDSHREVADMPELPDELSRESSTDWLKKALVKTTTVMLVWKSNPFKAGSEFSAPKLSELIVNEIPVVVAETVKKATEDSSGPFPLKSDTISKIVQDGVHLQVKQLGAVGQTHIRGVPQVSAQEVVDYVKSSYTEFVEFAEVDVAISIMDFITQEMAKDSTSDDHVSDVISAV